MSKLQEQLAELAHDQWSGWMEYLFGKCIDYKPGKVQAEEGAVVIPRWAVERWVRQAGTKYCDLSSLEQDSDRAEADKFLAVFRTAAKQLQAELDKYRWIPVEERLPEKEGYYLTKYKGDGRQKLNKKAWIRAYPFWGIFKENWIYKRPTKYSITHWKPIILPEGE